MNADLPSGLELVGICGGQAHDVSPIGWRVASDWGLSVATKKIFCPSGKGTEMATRKKAAPDISARREQLRAEHAEAVRENIQTTKLVKLLQDFALGNETEVEVKTKTGKVSTKSKQVEMSQLRMRAIENLLGKTLPDLSSVKLDVETDKVAFFINTTFTPPKADTSAE